MHSHEPTPQPAGISGKRIVVGMFAFAVVMTATTWIYWKRHKAPFVPLQKAIHAEFPDSMPVVQGGQRKMHQNSPRILRITMRVDFDPKQDEAAVERIVGKLIKLARIHQDLSSYEQLEIHLVWFRAEKKAETLTIRRNIAELFQIRS